MNKELKRTLGPLSHAKVNGSLAPNAAERVVRGKGLTLRRTARLMNSSRGTSPDLAQLRGVVAPEILAAVEAASRKLREAGIPHALAGGLAVGAHGYPRTTEDVDFLVGDEAFLHHPGGLVTLKVPLIAVGTVRIDMVSIEPSEMEKEQLRPALENPPKSEEIPIVPLTALVYMKLKASRQKDLADLVELLKRGKIDIQEMDRYLEKQVPALLRQWESVKALAAREE
jgi:hypothetical protein